MFIGNNPFMNPPVGSAIEKPICAVRDTPAITMLVPFMVVERRLGIVDR